MLKRSLTALLILGAVCLPVASAWAANEQRLALLIGNASYKSSPLSNPVNDVRLMDSVLKEAGFTVIKAENASIREMRRLVRDFGDKLKTSGGVGLFYFAGHGVQVRGENFLVSTDSDIRNEDEIADDALNVSVILDKMQNAGNRMNLIILDACRNNPFAVKSRSASVCLATINAPSGSLVAYSTSPGSVASDGKGKNGLYTEYLAKVIQQPGLPVEEVFKQVRSSVRKDSNNQQTPWENTALEGQFFFKAAIEKPIPPAPVALPAPPPAPVAVRPSAPDPVMLDMAFWESVKGSSRASELQAYLNQFPNGVFTVLAKLRLDEIKAIATAPPSKPVVLEQRPPAVIASMEQKPLTQLSPMPAAAPAQKPASQAAGIAGDVGTLVLTDTLFGKKRDLEVTVTESSAVRTLYSTGDAIAPDGKVLQVRIGDVVLQMVSGALWSLPLKEGTTGEAQVEKGNGSERYSGTVSWKVSPGGVGKLRVEAKISYTGRTGSGYQGPVYGNWTATYGPQSQLPESSSAVLRGQFAGLNNIVSSEFKPR